MSLRQRLERIADESHPIGPDALVERIERQLRGDPTTGLVVRRARRWPAWASAAAACAAAVAIGAVTILAVSTGYGRSER